MSLDENGRIKYSLIDSYRKGLDYLAKKGLDVKITHSDTWKGNFKEIIERMGQSSANEKGVLPVPFKIGNYTLSEKIMNVYNIRTQKDLTAYLRVVGIILSRFEGPEKYDHSETFVNRLKVIFQDNIFYGSQEQQIIKALYAYEQYFGKRIANHKILTIKDYRSLARILNAKFELYDAKQKANSDLVVLGDMTIERLTMKLKKKKELKRLFDVLLYNELIDEMDLEEFEQLALKSDYFKNLLIKIRNWEKEVLGKENGTLRYMFQLVHCKHTDEKLLKSLEKKHLISSLFKMLDFFHLYPVKDENELRLKIKDSKERQLLLEKIKQFCNREFGE